jgi:hypothetical protein
MAVTAITLFFISLVGIVSLFILKRWEIKSGIQVAAPWREVADYEARLLKKRLIQLESEMGTWLPKALLICRYFVHLTALAVARGLHRGEVLMHKLADRVSHKHRFERRATRSEFLKEVTNGSKGE